MDSIPEDSVILAAQDSVPEKKYLYGYDPQGQINVEQDYYNKYFGLMFIYLLSFNFSRIFIKF